MTNIVGPHGTGINETTTRPEDTASGNPLDTWFQPCVNGDPNTGTKIPAVWLNKVTALFRRAIRGMSVPEDELDDDMLLKAIRQTMPLLVNGTTRIGELNLTAVADGKFSPSVVIDRQLSVNVNVAPLTISPVLRSGFAQVTISASAFIDDSADVLTRNAKLTCWATNAGRTVRVAEAEMDSFAISGLPDDYMETSGVGVACHTILVPLTNGVGSFDMRIVSECSEGEIDNWSAYMHAYLDAVFPRAS